MSNWVLPPRSNDALSASLPPPHQPDVVAVRDVDLRDTSTALAETSAALALCLGDGDLVGAERMLGFLEELQPDRRLLLADVLEPLLSDGTDAEETTDRRTAFHRTTRELLRRQQSRRSSVPADVLLWLPDEDATTLRLHVVALLLDDAGVRVEVVDHADEQRICTTIQSRTPAAACLPTTRAALSRALLQTLRKKQVRLVLAADRTGGSTEVASALGASAVAATAGELADQLMLLRGPLTAAEATALKLAADGCTNVRIAHELGISVSAVKARLESSFVKLHASDRTHAVAIALRNRWIS